MGRWVVVAFFAGGALVAVLLSMSQTLVGIIAPPPIRHAPEIVFTDAYLNDPTTIAQGKKLWAKRCESCHGKAAYPGSAPKLRATRYQPTFIYDRITNGFRTMPALKTEFSIEERRAIVAYVKSPDFKD